MAQYEPITMRELIDLTHGTMEELIHEEFRYNPDAMTETIVKIPYNIAADLIGSGQDFSWVPMVVLEDDDE